MPRILSSIAIFFTFLPGSAVGQTGGRDLYIAKCSACHAPDGSANNTIGRSLKLSDIRPSIQSMTDEQLRQIIVEGKGKMPPLKKSDDEKLRKLTLFLRDLAAGNPDTGRAVAEAQAQPLSNVEEAFRDKCSACHAQDGTGRTTIGKSLNIPDLTAAWVQRQTIEELTQVISAGKGRMPAYAKTFNPVQAGQLVSYMRTLTKNAGATEPVESARTAVSTSQPQPSLPTQPRSTPPYPNSLGSTGQLKSPTMEVTKIAEPKPTTAPAMTKAPQSGRQIYIAKCFACHSSDGSGASTIGKSMRVPNLTAAKAQGQSDETLANIISNGVNKMPAYKNRFNAEQIQSLVAYIRELGKKH